MIYIVFNYIKLSENRTNNHYFTLEKVNIDTLDYVLYWGR